MRRIPLLLLLLGAVALLIGACAPEPTQRQPASADEGLHVTGRIDGRSINVSMGEPDVLLGACDPRRPDLRELCIDARTVDGEDFGITIKNPGEMVEGEQLEVRTRCPEAGCEGIALVDVRKDTDEMRADGGTLTIRADGPRYAARFTLRVRGDTLTGGFDVMPEAGR